MTRHHQHESDSTAFRKGVWGQIGSRNFWMAMIALSLVGGQSVGPTVRQVLNLPAPPETTNCSPACLEEIWKADEKLSYRIDQLDKDDQNRYDQLTTRIDALFMRRSDAKTKDKLTLDAAPAVPQN